MSSSPSTPLKELRAVFKSHSNKKLSVDEVALLSELLDDLSSRFLINLPDEELSSFERICFAIEQAHWFYEDYFCEQHEFLPSMGFRAFSAVMFHHCPLLQPYHSFLSDIMTGFSEYKAKIPTRGAILLDPTLKHCLIVKGWGSKGSWMFPKGKIDEGESDVECAIREVYEEIGFDIAPYISETDLVKCVIRGKEMRLFVIAGIPMDTVFETMTRKEISEIKWFPVADLPMYGENKEVHGISSKRMFTISAVSNKLRAWIRSNKKRIRKIIKARAASGSLLLPSSARSTKSASPATPSPSTSALAVSSPAAPANQRPNPFLNFAFDRPAIMSAFTAALASA
ncbi:mRNA decapping complex subunit Dcp2 [Thecamonas trahens ATCC 50062]|uniref:mRNA decapping complex subunit Dcp2 n=1 Tax=Thecamonas trahens ATCC 50062 TaxID=461836 RepID=A0A0L0DHJ2_THETB|nr:mRNA decapping complex subunit Dcp2 [Thecamonas trahens ATCC 50062]KNC50783.1 mRNA decapping complex subunit Dcp2 [Thecamonas trahens ATCC 50062]|eukprot:XP_013756742.1 mRNA decapping complex subunit Dcp2 [Thecamonas trahens ATCC 50062]